MTICIPLAQGVPGFSGQPPYWLPGHPTFPEYTGLDDPRWRGAFRHEPIGPAGESIMFRALHHVESGNKFLYLSWNAQFVPWLIDQFDVLYIGFQPGGSSDALVIVIDVHGTPAEVDAALVASIDVYTRSGTNWNTAVEPTWISINTRAWVSFAPPPSPNPCNVQPGRWSVQMRVPINTGASSIVDNNGPNLTDNFNLWYFVRGGGAPVTPAPACGQGSIALGEWPALGTTLPNLNLNLFPAPAGWEPVSTIPGDPACPTSGGIAIQKVDVGAEPPPLHEIAYSNTSPFPTNTFFARPRNYTGASVPIGGMAARFRIANWGSVATPAEWIDIPGGASVANSAAIPAISPGTSPPATNPIAFNWTLSNPAVDIPTYIGTQAHKCMLVELSGAGLTFFNDSVYRNMIFTPASSVTEQATVSIKGLGAIPGGGARRDVYLAVETINMPAAEPPDMEPPPDDKPPDEEQPPDVESAAAAGQAPGYDRLVRRTRQARKRGSIVQQLWYMLRLLMMRLLENREHRRRVAEAKTGQLTPDEIESFMPTYRVHVYHDTGEQITQNGNTYPVLRPQTTFGIYAEHYGPVNGWRHQLDAPADAQLEEIIPGFFYKIRVPNGGETTVRTTIEADEFRWPIWFWLVFLLLLPILFLVWLIWRLRS